MKVGVLILPNEYFSLEKKVPAPVENSAKLAALQERLIKEHQGTSREYQRSEVQYSAPIAAHAR